MTGYLLIAISSLAFGSMAIFARIAYASGVDPITLLFLRFAIAAIAMTAIVIAARVKLPSKRDIAALVAMGGIGYVGQSMSYFTALQYASAGLVALLLYIYPVLVTLLSAFVHHERIGRTRIIALVIATAGSLLTVDPRGGGSRAGITLALLAAVIYSLYVVFSARLTARAGALASSMFIMVAATSVYGVLAMSRGLKLPTKNSGWFAIIALALVSTVIAIVAFFAGMKLIGAASAAMISNLEPLFTIVLATMFLHEKLSALQIVGGLFIMTGAFLVARNDRGRNASQLHDV